MLEKIDCNGKDTHDTYQFLRGHVLELQGKQKNEFKQIAWNFAKFLVDSKGQVISHYGPKTPPFDIKGDIQDLLAK